MGSMAGSTRESCFEVCVRVPGGFSPAIDRLPALVARVHLRSPPSGGSQANELEVAAKTVTIWGPVALPAGECIGTVVLAKAVEEEEVRVIEGGGTWLHGRIDRKMSFFRLFGESFVTSASTCRPVFGYILSFASNSLDILYFS